MTQNSVSFRDWSKSIREGGGGGVGEGGLFGWAGAFGTKMTDPPLKQGWKLHDPTPS